MIRFIDLGKQIGPYSKEEDNAEYNDWPRQFAFVDTKSNRFIEVNGEQVFDSWTDFVEATTQDSKTFDINRYRGLCQRWAFKQIEVEGISHHV